MKRAAYAGEEVVKARDSQKRTRNKMIIISAYEVYPFWLARAIP